MVSRERAAVLPGLFGWEFIQAMEAPERFFIATIRGRSTAGIGELPADHPPVAGWNTYVAVTSADEAVAKVQAAGGEVLAPPFDAPYVRLTVLADPEGTPFTASQFVAQNQ